MRKGTAQRVLIVETGSVLDEGIKSLLAREPELNVSTVTYSDSDALLMEAAENHDIIVLSESGSLDRVQTSEFLRRISPQKEACLIIVRLEENILEIYDKRRLKVTDDHDLITVIKWRQGTPWPSPEKRDLPVHMIRVLKKP